MSKTKPTEELKPIRTHANGKVDAVHVWPTGYQVLEFTSQGHFDRFKKAIESKTTETKQPA